MSETSSQEVPRRVLTTREMDRPTTWLLWGVFSALVILIALLVYAWFTGGLSSSLPRTAQEQSLLVTAESIRANPKDGVSYAIRAETLYHLGRKTEAYQVLQQGQTAVAGQNPALLYILRTWTALLNSDGNFTEAEKIGVKAMAASDDYLARQGAALADKKVTAINGNLKTQESVDTAIQLAGAYMGEKKYAKAIELYNYALKLEPLGADLLTMRGYAFLTSGDKAKAAADFKQALQYLPNDPSATRGLKQASN